MFTVVYPVEEFEGNVSSSGISFIFTWAPPRIGAELTTHYNLICVPLLQGIPTPQGLSLSNTETSAEMSRLYSGVTYNCNISAVTVEGSSQPKSLILTTPEIGMLTIMILPLFECVYTHQHKYLQFHLVHQRCLRQCQEREKWCSPGLLLPLLSKMDLSLVTLSSALPLSPLSLSLSHLSPDPLSQ